MQIMFCSEGVNGNSLIGKTIEKDGKVVGEITDVTERNGKMNFSATIQDQEFIKEMEKPAERISIGFK